MHKVVAAMLTFAAAGAAAALMGATTQKMAPPTPAATPTPGAMVKLTTVVPDGKPHKFETRDKQFWIDGQPTLLIAGEMHFGRILPEDFETRVKQAKAMGLNTISFYLFWNQVEPEEGKFDFTGMNDVRRMFKICQDNGMWVLFRPGPYCCAEVEYGGIPYWTLKTPDIKIRTNDPKYVEWSRNYINRVYKEVADMQVTRGGPMLMVQEENEYGMVAHGDYSYMKTLHGIFKDAGFEIPIYTCDPGSFSGAGGANPYGDDVLRGRNGLNNSPGDRAYTQTVAAAGDFPVFAPEVYTAWFSGWGEPIATKNSSLKSITDWTNFLLDHNASWCYFPVFGGTNWGFNNGCNEYLPVNTSYDYSAPIDEAGRTNEKFRALRDILAKRTGRTLTDPPPEPEVIALPAFKLSDSESLLATLPAKPTATADQPKSFEELGQAYGFVDYRKTFPNGIKGHLQLNRAQDYAITMINGKTVQNSFIGLGKESFAFDVDSGSAAPVTLDILVHDLGRISVIVDSTVMQRARKGMLDAPTLDGKPLTGWDMYSLPMINGAGFQQGLFASDQLEGGPRVYHGSFTLDHPASTFLNLENFGMGVVWVNGHNLGRYWDVGGLRSLFLSSHFLKPGANDIEVLDLHGQPKTPEISGTTTIQQTPPIPWKLKLDQKNPAPPGAPRAGFGPRGGQSTMPATPDASGGRRGN